MRFCLSSQQGERLLKQADEIKTTHFEEVMRLLRKFPTINVVYEAPYQFEEEKLKELEDLNNKYNKRLIVCFHDLDLLKTIKDKYSFRFFSGFYVTTFLEARTLIDLGACYLRIAAPLTHQLEQVINLSCPIRLTPNVAVTDAIYSDYGIQGSWIRPEDYAIYNAFGDNIIYEFEDCDERKEATLFDIYKNKKAWAGPMNYLFSNLKTDALNRLIPPDLAKTRIKCGQRCLSDGRCHLCNTYITLADEITLRSIIHEETGELTN